MLEPEPEPEPVVPPQVPNVEPGWNTQVRPLQQSLLFEHWPVVFWQPWPQTSTPEPLGTHGSPLQQSPAKAHALPAITQLEPRP